MFMDGAGGLWISVLAAGALALVAIAAVLWADGGLRPLPIPRSTRSAKSCDEWVKSTRSHGAGASGRRGL
jgi:hypothetical protein